MGVKEIKSQKELENALHSAKPVAIFYYMETCPHCRVMHKPWGELSQAKPDVKFVKVESDLVPENMGITGFPHYEVFDGGKKIKSASGEKSKEELGRELFGGVLRGGRTRRRRARGLRSRRRKIIH